MSSKLFITGTDTDVGKTYVSVQLLQALNKQGCSTLGIKPIASGCQKINGVLYNDDALLLQENASIKLPYPKINPFSFEPAIAPHIAAQQANCSLSVSGLSKACSFALNTDADFILIEGAGGWLVPLNTTETMADFVKLMQFKVILVVGIKLGCINHALLSLKAIKDSGCECIGWIANCIDNAMLCMEDNINTLNIMLNKPCLARVDYKQPSSSIENVLCDFLVGLA